MSRVSFEADLDPETGSPRIRFNFSNGWSASLVLLAIGKNGCDAALASVAACPTGKWGEGLTELLGNELFADEAIEIIFAVALRGRVS